MVINLVKCFGQVYSTKIRCAASLGELFYNITNNTNSKAASNSLFKPELITCYLEERPKAI